MNLNTTDNILGGLPLTISITNLKAAATDRQNNMNSESYLTHKGRVRPSSWDDSDEEFPPRPKTSVTVGTQSQVIDTTQIKADVEDQNCSDEKKSGKKTEEEDESVAIDRRKTLARIRRRSKSLSPVLKPKNETCGQSKERRVEAMDESDPSFVEMMVYEPEMTFCEPEALSSKKELDLNSKPFLDRFFVNYRVSIPRREISKTEQSLDKETFRTNKLHAKNLPEPDLFCDEDNCRITTLRKLSQILEVQETKKNSLASDESEEDRKVEITKIKLFETSPYAKLDMSPSTLCNTKRFDKSENEHKFLFCQVPKTPKSVGSLSSKELDSGSTSERSDRSRGRKTNESVILCPLENTQMNLTCERTYMEDYSCESPASKANTAKQKDKSNLDESLMIDLTKSNTNSYRSEKGKTEENSEEESQSSRSGNISLQEVKDSISWREERKSLQSLSSERSGRSSCRSDKTLELVRKNNWILKTEDSSSQSETSSLCEQDIISNRSIQSFSKGLKSERNKEKFDSKIKMTKNLSSSDRSHISSSRTSKSRNTNPDEHLESDEAFDKYSALKVESEKSARSEMVETDKKNHPDKFGKCEPHTPVIKFQKSSRKSSAESKTQLEITRIPELLEELEVNFAKQSTESEGNREHSFRSTVECLGGEMRGVDADWIRQETSLEPFVNIENKEMSLLDKTDKKVAEESTSKKSTTRESEEDTQWKLNSSIENPEKKAEPLSYENSRAHPSPSSPSKGTRSGRSIQEKTISGKDSYSSTEVAVTDYLKNKENRRNYEKSEQLIHKTDEFEGLRSQGRKQDVSNPPTEREHVRGEMKRKSNKSTERSEDKTESSKVRTPKSRERDSSTARTPEKRLQQQNISNEDLTLLQKYNPVKVKKKAKTERSPKRISIEESETSKTERSHSHRVGGSTVQTRQQRPEEATSKHWNSVSVLEMQKKQSCARIEESDNFKRKRSRMDQLGLTPRRELLEKKPEANEVSTDKDTLSRETERKVNRLSKRSEKSIEHSKSETPATQTSRNPTPRIEMQENSKLDDAFNNHKNFFVAITQIENTEREERERKSNRMYGRAESLSGSPKSLKSSGNQLGGSSTRRSISEAEDVPSDQVDFFKTFYYLKDEEENKETERRSGERSEKTTERSGHRTPVTYRSEGSARQEISKAKLPLENISSRSSLSLESNEFTEETMRRHSKKSSGRRKDQASDKINQEKLENSGKMQGKSARSSKEEQKRKDSSSKTVEDSGGSSERTVLEKPETSTAGIASRSRTFNVEGYKYIQFKWQEMEEEVKGESDESAKSRIHSFILEEDMKSMFREKSKTGDSMWKSLIQEFEGKEENQEYFWVRAVDKPGPSKMEEPEDTTKGRFSRRSNKEKLADDKSPKSPRNLVGSYDSRSHSDKGTQLSPRSNARHDDNVQRIFYVMEERENLSNFSRIGDFGDGPSWKIDDFDTLESEKPRDHGDGHQILVSTTPDKIDSDDKRRQMWEEVADRVAKWRPLRYTWDQEEEDTWVTLDPLRKSKSDQWIHRKLEDAEKQSESTVKDELDLLESPPRSQKKRKRGRNSPTRSKPTGVGSSTESIPLMNENDVESLPSPDQRLSKSLSNLDLDRDNIELSGSVYNSRSEFFERSVKGSEDEKEATNLNLFLAHNKNKYKAEVLENNWLVVNKPDARKSRKFSKRSYHRMDKISCFQNFYRRILSVLCFSPTSSSASMSK